MSFSFAPTERKARALEREIRRRAWYLSNTKYQKLFRQLENHGIVDGWVHVLTDSNGPYHILIGAHEIYEVDGWVCGYLHHGFATGLIPLREIEFLDLELPQDCNRNALRIELGQVGQFKWEWSDNTIRIWAYSS